MNYLSAIIAAVFFGAGLEWAQMTNPEKVIGFLNIGGKWDPSLAFVMVGAIITNAILFKFTMKRQKPLFGIKFGLPSKTSPDRSLILGAAIFGAGWGLAGFCPGPALSGIFRLQGEIFIVVGSMIAGMLLYRFTNKNWPI